MDDLSGRGLPPPVARDRRRVVIEDVAPAIDGGRFPIKRVVGEPIPVSADVFADGADALRVVLRHRLVKTGATEPPWTMTPMRHGDGDRWQAVFVPTEPGYAEFAVVAWVDAFATWRQELAVRGTGDAALNSLLLEGAEIVRHAANHARSSPTGRPSLARQAAGDRLLDRSAQLRSDAPVPDRVELGLSESLQSDITAWAPVSNPITHPPLRARIERSLAGAAAWFDGDPAIDPATTSADANARATANGLALARDLGFDVTIVPTAVTGAEVAVLTSAATDAPAIARIAAFARAAIDAGLEPALRLVIGAASTDGVVRDRPQWFRHAPDGSVKLLTSSAESAGVAAFDFDSDAWEVIWTAIREQVLGWVSRGIRTFVVDDPETAPLPFWEWLIAAVQRDAPEAVFVCDGARRLAIAKRLSKAGASQIALTLPAFAGRSELSALLAPDFAAAEPADVRLQIAAGDIGSAATRKELGQARIQIALAATLSPACLIRPDRGLDDLARTSDLLRTLLRVRRTYGSFAAGSTLTFHDTDNEQLLCFSRVSADGRQRALVVVNLDPADMQHGWVWAPAAAWGLSGSYAVRDELGRQQFQWTGARNYVRLEPTVAPAHVLIFPDRS